MASFSSWITTFRLRTLPLSLSTIFLGSFLAAFHHSFHWSIFILAILTTLFLQTLSNLANDYGDTVHGVDNLERKGPKRSLQTGTITMRQMLRAIILFSVLSLLSGVLLLLASGAMGLNVSSGIIVFFIGLGAIAAAIKYTMGKNPYGYAGLGDLFVFVFFGIVGVMGSYFLYTHEVTLIELLPAASMGFFSTGVLNLNNLRDEENDKKQGKHTLVVRLGFQKARIYHVILIFTGLVTTLLYILLTAPASFGWLCMLTLPFFIKNVQKVLKNKIPQDLDPELKVLSLTTLAFSLLLGLGLLL